MTNLDDLPEMGGPAERDETATGSSHGQVDVVLERQSIQSIVAEGDDQRWQLARSTARAVFREPALVTPRRMALLGEEGLAAFVDDVRSLAKGFIRRERERRANSLAVETDFTILATEAPAAETRRQPRGLRRPAPFCLLQPEAPSRVDVLKRRLPIRKDVKAFIMDAVFGSVVAAVALALGLFAFRFALHLS